MANAFTSFLRRFVLPLLFYGAILYAALWLITSHWGAPQLTRALADEPSENSFIEIRRGDQVLRVKGRRPSDMVGVASTPGPLIVIWRPDNKRVNEWQAYFWFFGYTRQFYKTPAQNVETAP